MKLARDSLGFAIQALAPDANIQVAISAASSFGVLPVGSLVVRVAANQKCFIKFGTAGVVASGTDLSFALGSEVFRVPDLATHIAVIQDGAVTGVVSVTSMV